MFAIDFFEDFSWDSNAKPKTCCYGLMWRYYDGGANGVWKAIPYRALHHCRAASVLSHPASVPYPLNSAAFNSVIQRCYDGNWWLRVSLVPFFVAEGSNNDTVCCNRRKCHGGSIYAPMEYDRHTMRHILKGWALWSRHYVYGQKRGSLSLKVKHHLMRLHLATFPTDGTL